MSPIALFLLFIAGTAAWLFSTLAAGGAATLLIPLLAFVIGSQLVAPVIAVASLVASPSRVWLFRHHINWPVARWLLAGSLLGGLSGSYALTQIASQGLELLIGLFLMSTLLQYRYADKLAHFKIQRTVWFFPLALVVAFVSGIIGAAGPLFNPFLLNYGLAKEQLIGTKAINSFVMQLSKLTGYLSFGVLTAEVAGYGLALGLGGMLGIYLGKAWLAKISQQQFTLIVTLAMFASGAVLFVRGLGG